MTNARCVGLKIVPKIWVYAQWSWLYWVQGSTDSFDSTNYLLREWRLNSAVSFTLFWNRWLGKKQDDYRERVCTDPCFWPIAWLSQVAQNKQNVLQSMRGGARCNTLRALSQGNRGKTFLLGFIYNYQFHGIWKQFLPSLPSPECLEHISTRIFLICDNQTSGLPRRQCSLSLTHFWPHSEHIFMMHIGGRWEVIFMHVLHY